MQPPTRASSTARSCRCHCCLRALLLQFPALIYTSASIRAMASAGWPGMSREGALWFRDLTLPALQFAEAGVQLPMGLPGLVLPLALTGIMLTSIRLGFKATGGLACAQRGARTPLRRAGARCGRLRCTEAVQHAAAAGC